MVYTQRHTVQSQEEGHPAVCPCRIDLEGVMLTEVVQTEKGKYHVASLTHRAEESK